MTTSLITLDAAAARRSLAMRDLTDPGQGDHALQRVVEAIESSLRRAWAVPLQRHRANPVVPVEDNYDRLLYPPEAVVRDARYTRYLSRDLVLRTHTSALVPSALDRLATGAPREVVLSCPGIVYRRDAIDRAHVGEPHQLDLWRIRSRGPSLRVDDLEEMIDLAIYAILPGRRHRTIPAMHPYTLEGRQIDVRRGDDWLEVGECGLAHPDVLGRAGLPPAVSGLAMGLGLDRLLMLRKGIEDIRLLRAADPRVRAQMLDLQPYRVVSRMPPIVRDLSLARSGEVDAEGLGDAVRDALARDARSVESVEVLAVTRAVELSPTARERLGMTEEQCNVLVRVVLRDPDRTLTSEMTNQLRDRIYSHLHQGSAHQWAAPLKRR